MASNSIALRLDARNREVIERKDQPFGQRINNIIDRYAFIVDSRRAAVLALFDDSDRQQLALALKPIEAKRSSAVEVHRLWTLALPADSDVRAALSMMASVDVIVLLDAIEGTPVEMG